MTTTWHPLLQLLVIALGTARVTVLLVDDAILAGPRGRAQALIISNGGRGGYIDTLLGCQRCMGWWVSLAWFAAWCRWPAGSSFWAIPWAIATVAWWFGAQWLEED